MTRRARQDRHRRAATALLAGAAASLALPLCLAAIALGGAGAGLAAGPAAAHGVSTAALDNVHRFLNRGDFSVRGAPPEAGLGLPAPAAAAVSGDALRADLARLGRRSTFGESRLL